MTTQSKRDQYIDLLGRRAKDRVTSYEGTVITISFDLFGCVQAILKPDIDKDGKLSDGHWFDVNRLELVGDIRRMPVPTFAAKPAEHDHGPADKPRGRAQ